MLELGGGPGGVVEIDFGRVLRVVAIFEIRNIDEVFVILFAVANSFNIIRPAGALNEYIVFIRQAFKSVQEFRRFLEGYFIYGSVKLLVPLDSKSS